MKEVISHGVNLPVFTQSLKTEAIYPSHGKVSRASGITGHTERDHVPQKTNPANTAKMAVKARRNTFFSLRRIYAILPRAISAKTIVKIATVSTMPRAAR